MSEEETYLQMTERIYKEKVVPLRRKKEQLLKERAKINAEIKAIDLELEKPRTKQICKIDGCGQDVGNRDLDKLMHLMEVHNYNQEQRRKALWSHDTFKSVEIK